MTNENYENIWKLLKKYNFEIDSNLIIDLTCVICKTIVKDCRQSLCGCRYCCKCIETYLGGQDKICPGLTNDCKKQFLNISRDIEIDRVANMKVSRIVVKCPEFDCQHRDELRYIGNHTNSHNINCPYFEVGCGKVGLSNINIDDHLKDDAMSHSTMLMNSLQQLKNELIHVKNDSQKRISAYTDSMQNEMGILKRENINQSKLIDELKIEISNLNTFKQGYRVKEELIINRSHRIEMKNAEMETKFDELKILIGSIKPNQKSKKRSKSSKIAKIKPNLHVVPILIKSQQNMASFKWEIKPFSLIRRDSLNFNDIISKPFYSHNAGYKMHLVIWPNGCSGSNRDHLVVGFNLMKGEHDTNLVWPMMSVVRIALIDQESNDAHVSFEYDYNSTLSPDKSRFNRPIVETNKTIRTIRFICFTELLSNEKLYRNDSIILNCTVINQTQDKL